MYPHFLKIHEIEWNNRHSVRQCGILSMIETPYLLVIYKDVSTFLENSSYWVDSSLGKIVWHGVVTLKWSWAEMAMGRNDPEPVPCFSINGKHGVCVFSATKRKRNRKTGSLKHIMCLSNVIYRHNVL